jgi:hypothetical protein
MSFNTTELIANTAGYVIADTGRRLVLRGETPSFQASTAVTGAAIDAGWQLFGRKFALDSLVVGLAPSGSANFGAPPPATFNNTTTATIAPPAMYRTGYWVVMGYIWDRMQGKNPTLLDSVVNGVVAPMAGDFIATNIAK